MSEIFSPAKILEALARDVAIDEEIHLPVQLKRLPESLQPLEGYQKVGLARMQHVLRRKICEELLTCSGKPFWYLLEELRKYERPSRPIASEARITSRPPRKKEIDSIIGRTAHTYSLPAEVRERYHDIYAAILKQSKDVRDFRDGVSDGNQAYWEIFGRKPRGDIECISGGVSVYLRIDDKEDYTAAYYGLPHSKQPSAKFIKRVARSSGAALRQRSGHPLLQNAVTIENSGSHPLFLGYNVETFLHEQQHVLNRFFWIFDLDPLPPSPAPRIPPLDIAIPQRKSANLLRQLWLNLRAKDEIIAQRESGSTPGAIGSLLLQRGSDAHYDFADDFRKHLRDIGYLQKQANGRKNIIREAVIDPYRATLSTVSDTLERFSRNVADADLIRELLLIEPLERWAEASRVIRA